MRRPNNVFLSLHDASLDDVDSLDCDQSSSCRHDESAFCCPDDSLDTVMNFVPPLEDELLEALGIDCSSLLTLDGGDGNPKSAEDDMDVDVVETRTVESAGDAASAIHRRCDRSIVDVPPKKFSTTSTTSSSHCSLSSTSCDDSEYSLPVQEQLTSPFHHWTVPRKPRGRAGTVRKRPWPHPVIVAATGNQFGKAINGGSGGVRRQPTEPHPVSVAATGNQFAQGSNGGGSGGHWRPVNPRRRRPENEDEPRACSHCHSTDTPQWREGPLGRRTLCNACGLRYKMGREKLVPEYCPSTSPFFRDGKHSNRHSKVEKLRRNKEEKASMESR